MHPHNYRLSTSGERLYHFVRTWLADDLVRDDAFHWLSPGGHFESWSEYLEQLVAVSLTGRVIAAGRSLLAMHPENELFAQQFRSHLNDYLYIDKDRLNKLVRLGQAAVEASSRPITHGVARAIRTWARAEHPHCYLCGRILDFDNVGHDRNYTADHIWPRDFGGDSIDENLLPACRKCNAEHKKNLPAWTMTNVQALILRIDPTSAEFSRVEGTHRFALHQRRVQQFAVDERISLKDAYLQVGPSEDVRSVDSNDVGHFFNLANHDSSVDTW